MCKSARPVRGRFCSSQSPCVSSHVYAYEKSCCQFRSAADRIDSRVKWLWRMGPLATVEFFFDYVFLAYYCVLVLILWWLFVLVIVVVDWLDDLVIFCFDRLAYALLL